MIRIGTSKVRTGCKTCKARRVKCDEKKPFCKRCIKAKRACEGYAGDAADQLRGTRGVKFVYYGPRASVLHDEPDLTWSDRRALSYYQDRTAPDLAGAFQSDLWDIHILPLAKQSASVRHALLALSSIHERYTGLDHVVPSTTLEFGLRHYGRALSELVRLRHRPSDESTLDATLFTCALFSAIESLQAHYHAACNHASAGIKIIAEQHARTYDQRTWRDRPRQQISRCFVALGRQIVELGSANFQWANLPLRHPRPCLPDAFTSHEHALVHLECLLSNMYDFVFQWDAHPCADGGPAVRHPSFLAELDLVKAGFERWDALFHRLPPSGPGMHPPSSHESPRSDSSSSSAATPRAEPKASSYLVLKVYQTLMTACLARLERHDDAAFDEYLPDFHTAVGACEELIQQSASFVVLTPPTRGSRPGDRTAPDTPHPSTKIIRPTFCFSLGVVPALFLSATRTRDPELIQRALGLLKICNRREGFWDSGLAAKLAERIIDIKRECSRTDKELPRAYQRTDSLDSGCQLVDRILELKREGRRSPGQFDTLEFNFLDLGFYPVKKCVLRYALVSPGATATDETTADIFGGVGMHGRVFAEEIE